MLHRVTGEATYLEQARRHRRCRAGLVRRPTATWASRPSSWRSSSATCSSLPPSPAPAYRAAMLAYADRAWDDPAIHDPATDLFRFEGPASPCTLLDQAAMVQM